MALSKPETVVFEAANGNGAKITGFYFPSSAPEIKGVVQICHGMAEHMGRYYEFINYLTWESIGICRKSLRGMYTDHLPMTDGSILTCR